MQMRGLLALFWDVTTVVVDNTVRVLRAPAKRLGPYTRIPFVTALHSVRTLATQVRVRTIVMKTLAIARIGAATTRERISAVTQLYAPRTFALAVTSIARTIGTATAAARAMADVQRDPYATTQTRAHAVNVITRKVVIVNE